jgi:hypothetical protein
LFENARLPRQIIFKILIRQHPRTEYLDCLSGCQNDTSVCPYYSLGNFCPSSHVPIVVDMSFVSHFVFWEFRRFRASDCFHLKSSKWDDSPLLTQF